MINYCHNPRCYANNGYEPKWVQTDSKGGGVYETDCPYCGGELYENYVDTDALKEVITRVYASELEPLTRIGVDVNMVRISEAVLKTINEIVAEQYERDPNNKQADAYYTRHNHPSVIYPIPEYTQDMVGDEHE